MHGGLLPLLVHGGRHGGAHPRRGDRHGPGPPGRGRPGEEKDEIISQVNLFKASEKPFVFVLDVNFIAIMFRF